MKPFLTVSHAWLTVAAKEGQPMTMRELFGILLAMAGFALVCISLGASIAWRMAVIPRRAVLGSPSWTWLVAMAGAWLMAISFVLFEQWLIALIAAALGLVCAMDAVVARRTARREERW
jgi:hypothetical protein